MKTAVQQSEPRAAEEAIARQVEKIKPNNIRAQDQSGMVWRNWSVIWPERNVLQDLTDYPEIWSLLQGGRNTALRMDDRLYVVAWDRSWAVETVVIDADRQRVILSKPRVVWSGVDPRIGIRWQDQNFEVEWAGFGWAVYTKARGDRPRMLHKDGFQTVDAAKSFAVSTYPRDMR